MSNSFIKKKLANNIEYKEVEPDQYRHELYTLHELESKGISEEQLIWKYEKNPYGKMRVWVAWDIDAQKIAGSFAAFKRKFIFKGKPINAYQQADAKIDARYRRQGLFKKLVEIINNDLKGENAYFHFGYTNKLSASAFKYFNNSKEIYHTKVLVFPNGLYNIFNKIWNTETKFCRLIILLGNPILKGYNRFIYTFQRNDCLFEQVLEFNEIPENLSYELCENHKLFPLRDKKFLEWKVCNSPHFIQPDLKAYWIIRNDEKIGYVILYLDKSRNVLKILDLLSTKPEVNLIPCFKSIKNYAIVRNYDAVITNISSQIYISAAKKSGFKKLNSVRCNLFLLNDKFDFKDINSDMFWYQSPLDRDNFYY